MSASTQGLLFYGLDIPAVRFIETTVGAYPDPAWDNGSDPDFWFVEVVDIPDERREHLGVTI